jgi:hypothetical protein
MTCPNKPVKILSKNWERIESYPIIITNHETLKFIFPESLKSLLPHIHEGIPMDKHIEELIRIPESATGDFLDTYRAKFLPQEYDYKNQSLLRKYSNEVVKGLDANRLINGKENVADKYLFDFLEKHNINWDCFEYCYLTVRYFQFLLPQMPMVSRDKKQNISDLQSNSNDGEINFDGFFIDPHYFNKEKKSLGRTLSRFSFLPEINSHINLVRDMIQKSGEAQKLNNLILENDLNQQKRWINSKARKSLRQCIFCYRFFEGIGRVPRTCHSNKCKRADKAWKTLLERKGRSPKDFHFFNREDDENP